MPVGAAIAVGTMAAGMYGAKKQSDAAKAASSSQAAIAHRELDIEEEKFDIYKKNFLPTEQAYAEAERRLRPQFEQAKRTEYETIPEDREFYEEEVRPVEERMLEDARPDYDYVTAKAAADTDEAQDRAIGIMRRDLESRGVDPSSGNWQKALSRQFAGDRAANINASRERERNAAFDKMAVATGRGAALRTGTAGQPTPTRSGISLDPNLSGASQAFGNIASRHRQMSKDYARAAGQGAQALGEMDWGKMFGGGSRTRYGSTSSSAAGEVEAGTGYRAYARGGLVRPHGGRKYAGVQPKYRGSGVPGGTYPRQRRHYASGGLVKDGESGYAGGGVVQGPGDGKSDSVHAGIVGPGGQVERAMLSNGEYVVDAETVEQIVRNWLGNRRSGVARNLMP